MWHKRMNFIKISNTHCYCICVVGQQSDEPQGEATVSCHMLCVGPHHMFDLHPNIPQLSPLSPHQPYFIIRVLINTIHHAVISLDIRGLVAEQGSFFNQGLGGSMPRSASPCVLGQDTYLQKWSLKRCLWCVIGYR